MNTKEAYDLGVVYAVKTAAANPELLELLKLYGVPLGIGAGLGAGIGALTGDPLTGALIGGGAGLGLSGTAHGDLRLEMPGRGHIPSTLLAPAVGAPVGALGGYGLSRLLKRKETDLLED